MERKKWWASLIAVAVGLALSVGSASAYERGDWADATDEGKLIPYYMAADNLATIIGIQNMSGTGDAVILEVAVHDMAGALQATGELCLAENQFGYAVLKEEMMMDDGMMMDEMMVTLMLGVGDQTATVTGMPGSEMMTGAPSRAGSSVETMPGEGSMIGANGFVVIRETFTVVNSTGMMDACDQPSDATDDEVTATDVPDFATWAILQDIGEGSFFGTEVPSVTVNVTNRAGADGDPDTDADNDADGIDCSAAGECEGAIDSTAADRMATVRFDNNMMNDSMSMIYVWLDSAVGFDAGTGMRTERNLNATVHCEGAAMPMMMELAAPDQVNMISGSMLDCDARGVAVITLDTANHDAGVVWSHIAQMGGGFRMNFAGYENTP